MVKGLRAGADFDFEGVRAEQEAYVQALETAGVSVRCLDPLAAFADSLFVEDPVLVFPDGAILLWPGNAVRRGEVAPLRRS